LLFQVLRKSVDKVIGAAVAFMNQRIVHIDRLDTGRSFLQASDVVIVFPDCVSRSTDIGLKLAGISEMQVSESCGQHDHVSGALK
jgi:hypothetical protein